MTASLPTTVLHEWHNMHKARLDPCWFAETVLGFTGQWALDIWQRELFEAVADVYRKKQGIPTKFNHEGKTQITIRAMHGPGKTFSTAGLMHWFNYCFYGRIVCTAPKEKQLQTRLWPAFRKILAHAHPAYSRGIKVDSLNITWHGDPDWCAIAETASTPENLAGYHDDYMLIVVDEASGVDEAMFPVIEGMASTGKMVIVVLIGNPTKNIGTFYDSHMRPVVAKHYHQIHVDLNKTTRVSKEWVAKMEEKYGRNSPVVKVRCYGEFADMDEAQLITYEWLTRALEDERDPDGSIPRLRVAVDVADGGVDSTVVTIARMYDTFTAVLERRLFNFPPAESPILAAQAAMTAYYDYNGNPMNGDDLVVDSLGVGAGTAGYLIEKRMPVVAYRGGEASDDTKQWRNRRTQSYMCLRDALRDRRITFGQQYNDGWDEFAAQACSIRTVPGSERVEDLETKESMKRRGIKSPDEVDSLAMLFATQTPTLPIRLEAVHTQQLVSAEAAW